MISVSQQSRGREEGVRVGDAQVVVVVVVGVVVVVFGWRRGFVFWGMGRRRRKGVGFVCVSAGGLGIRSEVVPCAV